VDAPIRFAGRHGHAVALVLKSRSMQVLGFLLSVSACNDNDVVGSSPRRAELAWFTPQIASQLDANGQLPGATPELASSSDLSAEQAVAVAERAIRIFGNATEGTWKSDAGYEVKASALHKCGRVDYIESAYDSIPASTPAGLKTQVGGQWVIRYCATGGPAPVVEYYISASGMENILEPDGSFKSNTPLIGISTRAISRTRPENETSEDAAGDIYRAGRGQVAALPRMRRYGVGYVPWVITWTAQVASQSGARSTVIARIAGFPRTWTLRSPVTDTDVDTIQFGSTELMNYRFRRAPDAITRKELAQQFGAK
jgi:hypothetical protein